LFRIKSPDNVPDTFTPDAMQPKIRSLTALCPGYTRSYPVLTSLVLNETSVDISLNSAPLLRGYFPLAATTLDFIFSFAVNPHLTGSQAGIFLIVHHHISFRMQQHKVV